MTVRLAHFLVHNIHQSFVVIDLLLLFSPFLICCWLYTAATGYPMLQDSYQQEH